MFPTTDSSQTIISCLLDAAENAGVTIRTQRKTAAIVRPKENGCGFVVTTEDKRNSSKGRQRDDTLYDAVILATGSSPSGYKLASELGLKLIKPVPSLFTLSAKEQVKDDNGLLHGLAGLSVPMARISFKIAVPGKKKKRTLQQEGPLLITHHGISGPATLRLSAFGARDFYNVKYKGDVVVHWAPELGTTLDVFDELWNVTFQSPKRLVVTSCPLMRHRRQRRIHEDDESLSSTDNDDAATFVAAIPKRLWQAFCRQTGIGKETTWGAASKKSLRALAQMMCECVIHVTGKGVFKEEFVTAGGVSLKEIDMRSMESKSCPGLFLCGELIDVDGVTGGYNFMNCWSTGYVAGENAANYVLEKKAVEQAID